MYNTTRLARHIVENKEDLAGLDICGIDISSQDEDGMYDHLNTPDNSEEFLREIECGITESIMRDPKNVDDAVRGYFSKAETRDIVKKFFDLNMKSKNDNYAATISLVRKDGCHLDFADLIDGEMILLIGWDASLAEFEYETP